MRFKRNHERVVITVAKRARRDSTGEEIGGDEHEQVPEGDENGELNDAQLRQAEQATANRPGAAIRIGDAIERICARDNLQIPDSPPKRMRLPSPQRAGKSYNELMLKLLHNSVCNLFAGPSRANLPCSGIGPRRIVYSSDEEEDAPPRPPPVGYRPHKIDESDSDDHWPARNPNRQAQSNPIIETEAGVDGHASADEDDRDAGDLDGFIVDDDVF